jgi:hypothetical protein
MAETIEQLIQQANANIATITNAFGANGVNLTRVINNNNNIAIEIGNIFALIESFEAKITELFTDLSNARSDEEFQQLEQQIRLFLEQFNQIIPTLGLNRFNGDISVEQLNMATQLVTNIRNKDFAYVKKGPNYRANNDEFRRISDFVKGNYTKEADMTFKNNNTETIITFAVDRGNTIPNSITVDGIRTDVVRAGMNFTTTINGNPYFLVAYSFESIPRQEQIRAGGSKRKRKRRRTRKNKRKSIAKKQKGGFNYNNKIPSSKKKSSKRTSSNSNSSTKTTSTSSSK